MKHYFGLFLLMFSFSTHAETSATLNLRGFVAEKVSMKVEVKNGKPQLQVLSNSLHRKPAPQLNLTESKNYYTVAIIQP